MIRVTQHSDSTHLSLGDILSHFGNPAITQDLTRLWEEGKFDEIDSRLGKVLDETRDHLLAA